MRWLKDFRLQLAVIVLGGWLVRLWAVQGWSRHLELKGDQNFYWRQGQDLAEGFGFVYRNSYGERVLTAVHPPLHSAFLGVVSFLGGTSPYAHRLACTFMGALAVALVGLAGRRVGGNVVGLVAAGLAAVYPNLWFNDALLLSESTYAATIAAVLLASYRFRDRSSLGNAALLGVTIGLAALTRAEAVLLFVLLAVPLVLWRGRRATKDTGLDDAESLDAADVLALELGEKVGGRFGRRLRQLGVVWLAGGLVIAPWVLRNLTVFEHPATMSTGAGYVIEISNCDQTYGLAPPYGQDGQPDLEAGPDKFLGYWAVECDRTPWPAGDETVAERAKRRTGTEYMRDHQERLPQVLAARVGRIWDVWRPAQSIEFNAFFESRTAQADFSVLGLHLDFLWQSAAMRQWYLMLLLGLGGLVVLVVRRVTVIPFLALAASATLAAAVSFGITRYRVGVDVAVCLLAAVPVGAAWDAFRRRRAAGGGRPGASGPSERPLAVVGAGPGRAAADDAGEADAAGASMGGSAGSATGRPPPDTDVGGGEAGPDGPAPGRRGRSAGLAGEPT